MLLYLRRSPPSFGGGGGEGLIFISPRYTAHPGGKTKVNSKPCSFSCGNYTARGGKGFVWDVFREERGTLVRLRASHYASQAKGGGVCEHVRAICRPR